MKERHSTVINPTLSNSVKTITMALALLTMTVMPAAYAFSPPSLPPAPPDSGAILDSVKPPALQQNAQIAPTVTVDNPAAVPSSGEQKTTVTAFTISGESPVPAAALLALLKADTGKELTLSQMNGLADRLTRYLRAQGYLVAFAYLPPQDIKNGLVNIAVVPGKYGRITVTGHGHIAASQLTAMLACAKPGAVITRAPLERALLLIGDLSGVQVTAALKPGASPGVADLILNTADTAKFSGAVYSDNWGSRYTGRQRYGAQLSVNDLSGRGDTFNLGGLTTFNGINNYNIGYTAPIGGDGLTFNLSYAHVGYTLGDSFANLNATGRTADTGYQLSYPFLKSRSASLYGNIGYDHKQIRDDIGVVGNYNPRSSNLWHLGLSGAGADNWLGGGANSFSLTQYWGRLNITDAATRAGDTANAQTNGNFSKTVLTAQRRQSVAQNLNLTLNFTGQLADKNLDSSEKLYLGGANGVRAYPQGEGGGDQGFQLTTELSWRLPALSTKTNSLYLNTFYDYGRIKINKCPYTTDTNDRSLSALGLGLQWERTRDLSIRLDYSWKIGQNSAVADTDKKGRCWLQVIKYF